MATDTCVENFSGVVLKALAASTPTRRPLNDPRPSIPSGFPKEKSLKTRMRRQWQITRDPALIADVNRLLNEWSNDKCNATTESLDPEDPSLSRMTKRVRRVPTPSSRLKELRSALISRAPFGYPD